MSHRHRLGPRRSGLTLMELIVVLTIIVAITGIVVAILPNMIHRANVASCTANITELDKVIQSYESLYSEIPNKYDNLVVGSSLASYVLDGSKGQYGKASITVGTLTDAEAQSLSSWGLVQLANIVEDSGKGSDWRPTFWPYSGDQANGPPTFTNVTGGMKVAVLTGFGAQLMGVPTPEGATDTGNYKFVLFGINKPCSVFRNVASEPPYHFADVKTEDPASFYMAFGGVYMVTRDYNGSAKTMTKARYMGSIAFHDFGLATGGSHTKEWWDQLKDDRPLK